MRQTGHLGALVELVDLLLEGADLRHLPVHVQVLLDVQPGFGRLGCHGPGFYPGSMMSAMLSADDNAQLTRVGPGTLMGAFMRRYWIPVVRSSEIAAGGRPRRVKLLGEDLLVYRDPRGRAALVSEFCAHRRASLYFARNEERGLRCVYHG